MSVLDNNGPTGRPGVKTLAIRLEPDLHAQLSLIAQLRGATITDEIKAALEAHITAAKTMPELTGRADAVLADIERDATAKRAAIATLFGSTEHDPAVSTPEALAAGEPSPGDPEPSAPQASSSRSRGGRRGGSEDAGN